MTAKPQANDCVDSVGEALGALSSVVGVEHVCADGGTLDRYGRSGMPEGTMPMAVVSPGSTQQVRRVVEIAARFGLKLYPISRGKNWGYGAACAPTPGQVIVDLGRMNRVLEVDRELAYAVIEPGVTQGQLWEHLQHHAPDLWMDATGAGPEASVVGNTLDRGFGHTRYGDHFLHTCGMEVVLADGRVLNTGYGHYANAKAGRVYRYGVGPSLDGLFAQSNFGIVTRIGIWLIPRPEAFCGYFFQSQREEDLERLVDAMAALRRQGLLQTAIHIANDLRVISSRTRYPWQRTGGRTPLPEEVRAALRREYGIGAWSGCGAISGTRGSVAAVKKAVKGALRGFEVKFLDDGRLAMARRLRRWLSAVGIGGRFGALLDVVEPLYGLLQGRPSIEHLRGAAWRVRGEVAGLGEEDGALAIDPLDCHAGLMWVSPVAPAKGTSAREVMRLIEPIYQRYGFEALVTFTIITERAMCCVTNLAFDKRDTEETARAGRCYDTLMTVLIDAGYVPYRTSVHGARKLGRGSSVFWDVRSQLKRAMDPRGILAPGRYEPQ